VLALLAEQALALALALALLLVATVLVLVLVLLMVLVRVLLSVVAPGVLTVWESRQRLPPAQ